MIHNRRIYQDILKVLNLPRMIQRYYFRAIIKYKLKIIYRIQYKINQLKVIDSYSKLIFLLTNKEQMQYQIITYKAIRKY